MKKIIKFWGSGCMPCIEYSPIFDKVKNELLYNSELEFHNIDARNDNTGLTGLFKIKSIPHTIILIDDKLVKEKSGIMREDELKKFILED